MTWLPPEERDWPYSFKVLDAVTWVAQSDNFYVSLLFPFAFLLFMPVVLVAAAVDWVRYRISL